MTTDPTPVRIPIGRNVTYAVRGMPEVANEYGPGYLVPTEISLTYRATEDSQLGRFHAYVKGHWRRDGEEVSAGEKLPGQHYYGDPSTWPAWLAEEARLHDPDAVLPPPADRAAVLLEAADAVAKLREKTDINVAEYQRYDFRQRCALGDAEGLLRRLAAAPAAVQTEEAEA
ncbi:hypothetical protein [Streptomyces sp. NPDC050534]|uniref:hypothetical protein n=1 Tax=Streptomyces sp. NPDC050534 TaxID=3365625 RepID=UPI0037A80783